MQETAATPPPPRAQLVAVPDLAGTPAADARGQFFGEVYGSLAESGSGLIRYLDVDVHGQGRHVLVPIGHVRVPRPEEPSACVRLRAATVSDLATIPAVGDDGDSDDGAEEALLAAFGRFFAGERYYAHPAFDHSGLYDAERPLNGSLAPGVAGVLVRLSRLERFEIAEGEPDIRGWRLRTRDSIVPGEVTDLVVEPQALKVRYIVIRLRDDREVLLPVGYLDLEPARDVVRAPGLQADDVRALPTLREPITRAEEDAVRAALEARLSGRRRFQRADFLVRP